jgi:hypothetical protein
MFVAEELSLEYEDNKVDLITRRNSRLSAAVRRYDASTCATKECANILKRFILESAIE